MKKTTKLVAAIVTVAVLITFIILCKVITIGVDFNLTGIISNICAWIIIPLASIILGALCLRKHLWLSLVAVSVLEITLAFIITGEIPINPFNYGYNTEDIALTVLFIQLLMTLVVISGIYGIRAFRKRKNVIIPYTRRDVIDFLKEFK